MKSNAKWLITDAFTEYAHYTYNSYIYIWYELEFAHSRYCLYCIMWSVLVYVCPIPWCFSPLPLCTGWILGLNSDNNYRALSFAISWFCGQWGWVHSISSTAKRSINVAGIVQFLVIWHMIRANGMTIANRNRKRTVKLVRPTDRISLNWYLDAFFTLFFLFMSGTRSARAEFQTIKCQIFDLTQSGVMLPIYV